VTMAQRVFRSNKVFYVQSADRGKPGKRLSCRPGIPQGYAGRFRRYTISVDQFAKDLLR